MQFAMLPLQGLGQGAQPIMSYNYGAKNADRVKSTFLLLLKASLTYSIILWGLVMLFPQVFAGIFTSNPASCCIYQKGSSCLHGSYVYVWNSDFLPDGI